MAGNNAPRDGNFKATILGVSSAGFSDTVTIAVNPSTHAMLVEASFAPSGTQDVNLTKVGGVAVALGQTTMSASIPVVLASNQASIPVAATLSAETTKVIGTVNQGTSPWVVSLSSTTITGTVAVTQSTSPWIINVASATGSAIPANAFFLGVSDATNLRGVLQVANSTDTTGNGILAAGMLAQFDDTSPSTVTENQFANIRMSSRRALYVETVSGGSFSITSITPSSGATNLGKAEDAGHTTGDVGVFALAVRNDGANTSFTNANTDYNPIATDSQGRVYVVQKAPTATLTNVAGSATSVTLLAANDARIDAMITNDSSAVLYIKFGTTASTTSYTVVLAGAASAPFSYYEVPGGYTGRIDGIWASATGNARVTELT